ncbi:hypothetical protein L9F63_006633, partial [Diploptera punctata]
DGISDQILKEHLRNVKKGEVEQPMLEVHRSTDRRKKTTKKRRNTGRQESIDDGDKLRNCSLEGKGYEKIIHENEVFSCDKCELVFEEEEDFKEHAKIHQNEKTNVNQSEHINENGKRKLEQEEKRVKKLKTDEMFPLDESVKKQIEDLSDEMHWICKVWQCKLCNNVSLTKQGWRDHICDVQELLVCSICDNYTRFYTESELEQHYQLVHGEERIIDDESSQCKEDENIKYQCPTCEEMFDTWLQLCQHSKIHLGQFKCPHCERTFNRQTNLANHIKRHKTETGFTCRICLQTFSNRGELLLHRRNHTREECPICYRTHQTKQKLDNHIAMHTDSSFPCHICGKVLSKKNTLEYHLRTHTGEKPYTCSMCPCAFQSRVGLIVHERIHTGEKPYQCDQCDMAFRCRATLNQHKVVHSEERPFQCTHCGRGFRRRDTLDTHIRTHTDERPYACRICLRAFRQKGDCRRKFINIRKTIILSRFRGHNGLIFKTILATDDGMTKRGLPGPTAAETEQRPRALGHCLLHRVMKCDKVRRILDNSDENKILPGQMESPIDDLIILESNTGPNGPRNYATNTQGLNGRARVQSLVETGFLTLIDISQKFALFVSELISIDAS